MSSTTAWVLGCDGALYEERLSSIHDIHRIVVDPVHYPTDCDNVVYTRDLSIIYMCYSNVLRRRRLPRQQWKVNWVATRILLDKFLLEPPLKLHTFDPCVANHVLLFAVDAATHQLVNYDLRSLARDWPLLFVKDAPYYRFFIAKEQDTSSTSILKKYLFESHSGLASQCERILAVQYGAYLVKQFGDTVKWESFNDFSRLKCFRRRCGV